MRADAVASGSSASKSAAPRRRAREPRVRVVEAWVFTCRFRAYCHVLTGCGRTPVQSQCIALATPISYRGIVFYRYQLRIRISPLPLPTSYQGIAFTSTNFVSGYRLYRYQLRIRISPLPLPVSYRDIAFTATGFVSGYLFSDTANSFTA